MMKIALAIIVTIFALIGITVKPLRAHRGKIMAAYAVMVIFLFAFYNYRTKELILPFYKHNNQMFYQSRFADTGEYPDALLPYVLKGKTIVIPNIVKWDDSIKETYDFWQNGDMINMNLYNIFTESGARVEFGDYIYLLDKERQEKDMTRLGFLNDTFRYSYFYNDLESEYGNGFYYYWFYGANAVPFEIALCEDGFVDADTLYVLFDENGSLNLVSQAYYDKEVANAVD